MFVCLVVCLFVCFLFNFVSLTEYCIPCYHSLCHRLSAIMISFGFSSKQYGGDFAGGMSLPNLLWILVAFAIFGLFAFYVVEDKHVRCSTHYFIVNEGE